MTSSAAAPQPLALFLAASEPGKRNRLTALIRIIMVIPQYIVLYFLGIAALVVLIIGWFGALFTGRLPKFAETFLSGVLRWGARVSGYFFLLTDQYPPFSLQTEPQYPIQIAIPPAADLNRLSVLFRIILVIPAAIVSNVLSAGLAVVSVASWATVVFGGRLPIPLFEATQVVIRYQVRLGGWFAMLTAEYPWGPLGDGPAPATVGEPAAANTEGWLLRVSSGGRTALIVIVVLGVLELIFNSRRF